MSAIQTKHEVVGKLLTALKSIEKEELSNELFSSAGSFAGRLIKDAIDLLIALDIEEIQRLTK